MNKKCQGWDFQLKYMIKKHQGIIQKVLLSDIVNPAFAAFVQYYEWTFQLKYMNKKCQGIVQKVLLSNIVDPAFSAFVKYYDEGFSV